MVPDALTALSSKLKSGVENTSPGRCLALVLRITNSAMESCSSCSSTFRPAVRAR